LAFVNEKMTPEQREEFRKRGVKKLSSDIMANPINWTIDNDNKMFMWDLGVYSRDDFQTHVFLFESKGETHTVMMDYSYPDPTSEKIIWSISKYEKDFCGNESFSSPFKDALVAYAINGSPNQRGKTIVEVNF
jgi:hypothetical protein